MVRKMYNSDSSTRTTSKKIYHGIDYEYVTMLKIQNVWKLSVGKSSSTLWKYFKPLAKLIKRCCKSSNTNCNTYVKLTAVTKAPRWCCQQMNLFPKKKWTKWAWNEIKKCFFFLHFFVTQGHIPTMFNWLDLILSAKAPSIPKHIFND